MGSVKVQGELWGRDPQAWAGLQEPQMRPIYDATLDALEPLAGTALLDADALKADRKPDGRLRQDNVFRYVLATKP